MRQLLKHYANPAGNPVYKRAGLENALELGLLYLEQWRLDDADRLFTELLENPYKVREYTMLGRLGRAMVLAFQNRPAESNKLFLEILGDRLAEPEKAAERKGQVLFKPQLRHMIARALDYNAANASPQHPFPPQLELLRRPPNPLLNPIAPKKGSEKPAGKGT
jgi:hypothetical protein